MEQNKREIKFRAWNGKSMYRIEGLRWILFGSPEEGKGIRVDENGQNDWKTLRLDDNKCVLMQFTGLLDKNGKEIYCGDIVKGYFDTNEVEDYIWLSLTDEEKKNGWKLFKIDMDIVEFARQQLPDELEIVGNVMENPNLLSEK